MPEYEVHPGKSIGPVRLGMTRAEARTAMGTDEPHTFQRGHESIGFVTIDAYFANAFQINLDADEERVEFIEAVGTRDVKVRVLDVDPFGGERTQVTEALAAHLGERPTIEDDGDMVTFHEAGLTLWSSEESDKVFATVAVFGPGYYDRLD
jgi:hypothetical protein